MHKSEEEGRYKIGRNALMHSIVICIAAVIISSFAIPGLLAQETGAAVEVRVTQESEYVEEGATFSVTIDVDDVTDLETGQFDLSFDSDVLELKDVEEGSLGGETLPIVIENLVDAGTVRVVCVVSEETASGSGHLAKVSFKVIGNEGDESVLDLSDGELSDTGTIWFYIDEEFRDVFNGGKIPDEVEEKLKSRERTLEDPTVDVIEKDKKWKITDKRVYMVIAKDSKLKIQDTGEIFTNWVNAEISVGGVDDEEDEEDEEVSEEVITPGSPKITVSKPAEAVVGNVVRELRTFTICVNQIADISWQINGSVVQTNESVTEASFTKSAVIGSWNVSAIATNATTGLSDTHSWIWHVTLTATPSPTLAPRVTPAPTRAPGVTPTPKPAAITRTTARPKSTPTPTPTPKPAGFDAIFAIAMLAFAFLWVRKR